MPVIYLFCVSQLKLLLQLTKTIFAHKPITAFSLIHDDIYMTHHFLVLSSHN